MPLPSMTCSIFICTEPPGRRESYWRRTEKMSLFIKTSLCISVEVHSVYPCSNKVRAIFAYLTTKVNSICAEFTIKVSPIIKRLLYCQ